MVGVEPTAWGIRWVRSGRLRGSTLDVLFGVGSTIGADGVVKIDAAAAAARVSRRTLERGMRKLEKAGAIVRGGRRGRYIVVNLRHP